MSTDPDARYGHDPHRLPHVRRVHLPPAEPPRESLASLFLGLAAIVVILLVVVLIVPVLAL
jgi:hypothetical protein